MRTKTLLFTIISVVITSSCNDISKTPEPITAEIQPRVVGDETVVVLGGDTMLDDLGLPFLLKYGYSYPLADLSPIFKDADISVVNLEAPAVRECNRVAKRYSYFAWPESLVAMKEAGINVLDLANNHAFDCGSTGLEETIKNIENAGLFHFGAGKGELAHRGLVIKVKKTRIGFLGYWKSREESSGWALANPEKGRLTTDIKRMKRYYCDVLLVVFHWGNNYHFDVYKSQRQLAHTAISAGADAVVGHHPHIPQPVEIYRGRPIVYSVGNLAFGTGNNNAKNGLLARFIIGQSKIKRTEIIPLLVQNRSPMVLWQTKVLDGSDGKAVIDQISSASKKYHALLRWENGVGLLTQLK